MKNTITFWLIILLVIANIGTISVFWLRSMNSHPRPPEDGPKDFIIHELDFNPEQQTKYQQLVIEHQQKAEEYQIGIRKAKDRFFELLNHASVNDSLKYNAAKEISKQTEKLDLLTFDHFQKVRELCSDKQKAKFDSIIKQVLHMMARPKPPGNMLPPPDGR